MATRTRSRSPSSARPRKAAARAARREQRWADRLIDRLPRLPRDVADKVRGPDILLYASGLSFYALVSAAPLAVVAAWVASLILGDSRIHQLATEMQQTTHGGVQLGSFVRAVADAGTSIGVTAVLTALWPASSYGAGLRRAFDRLSSRNPREAKGLRGRGLAILVLLPLFVVGSLAGSFVGTQILGDSGIAFALSVVLALVTGFVAAAIGVFLIYRIFPPERMPPSSILKGTLFSAATISVVSLGMTLFVGASGGSERQHFGTMGMALLVLFAVWLFLANALLLVGYVISLED
ncbi:MAG: YihY/virulence factor BrkB family protein [Actinomycetota bacterium]